MSNDSPFSHLPLLNPPGFTGCFVCGLDNPHGLKLRIHNAGDHAVAQYISRPGEVGYPGRFHGGLVGLLVDEMLVYAGVALGEWSVTARVEYRLRQPVPEGAAMTLSARVTRRARAAFRSTVEVRVDDDLVADGQGMCVLLEGNPQDVVTRHHAKGD